MTRSVLRLMSVFCVGLGLLFTGWWIRSGEGLSFYRQFIDWIGDHGQWKYTLFVMIYTLAPFLLVPVLLLTLTAGALFGPLQGSVVSSGAALLSAVLAFGLGKVLARTWVLEKIERQPRYRAVDKAVGKKGWKIVLLLRLTPFFPFALINFSLGSTKIKLWEYAWATWLGMLPGIIVYTYLGSLLAGLADITLSGRNLSLWEWLLSAMGGLALLVLFAYLIKVARKALSQEVPEEMEKR